MAGSSPAMTSNPLSDLLPGLRAVGLAVTHQAIEMHADMGGFGRGIGERDRAIEGDARLVVAAKLHQKRAAYAEEVEIIRKPRRQGLDQFQRRLGPTHLGDCDRAVER